MLLSDRWLLTRLDVAVRSVVAYMPGCGCQVGVFEIENIASIDISINIGKLILKVDIEGR